MVDGSVMISPAFAPALRKAQPGAVLRAAYDLLPDSPDTLNIGDPCIPGNTLRIVGT